MNAYYYSFDETGVLIVDKILEAVARAGKAYHHTECWNDEGIAGGTPVEWIQQAADKCAAEIKEIKNTTTNTDYTAALFEELKQFNKDEDLGVNSGLLFNAASRLNSVLQNQNCV